MAGAVAEFFRLLGQGLSLASGRRPQSIIADAGFGKFVAAWLCGLVVYAATDWALTPAPRQFAGDSVWIHAGFALALLLSAWLVAGLLRRGAAWITLAALVAIAAIPWAIVDTLATWHPAGMPFLRLASRTWVADVAELGVRVAMLVVLARIVWVFGSGSTRVRRVGASALAIALLVIAWTPREDEWFWSFAGKSDHQVIVEEAVAEVESEMAHPATKPMSPASRALARGSDPETLLGRQPAMVAAATAALAPQTPGHVDLYGLGFAGDGNEATFRNEVEYFGQLLPARFGAKGRTLQLINHPGTVARTPLATLANLRDALAGIGKRMDPEEDVLLLVLTSHGSPDHYLAVEQPPLPLRQVHPADIRDALDDAGIRWRVIVVSACYSGGFIDKLRDPRTLVITAARADRPSFGCGADSEITWFGHAFLTEALNQTTDFREAYTIAARNVRARERESGDRPSQPQIWAGAEVDAKLAAWRAGVAAADAVPFVPAVPSANAPAGQE